MRAWIPLILAAACGTPSSSAGKQDPLPDPSKPDEVAVAIPTRIEARFVTVMLGTQWRDRVVAEAIHVDRSNPDEWILRGSATVRVGKIVAKASEEAKVKFLSDHDHFVLHAKFVSSLERDKEYTHKQADLHMATIADSELNTFSR